MLAEKENCQWMREEGVKAYGRALLQETAALRSPSRSKSDAVLLASKFMTTYEMLFGGGTGNLLEISHRWRSHNVGSLAIMEARTPRSAIEGDGHHIFLDSRLFWIIDGIKQRKRTALSRDDWKTVPWSKYPKRSKDMLTDILVEIPGVFEDMDRCESLSDEDMKRKEYRRLVIICLGLHAQLQVDMYTMLLYWSTCLYLYNAMQVHSRRRPADVPPFLPQNDTNLGQYVTNMCLLLPFFFSPNAGRANLLLAAFPLGTALQFTSMLMTLFKKPEFKPIMDFLNSLQRDNDVRGEQPEATYEGRAKQWAGYTTLERK
ncbi:hypothetical protein diail_11020 [Diaporthe ilicicola]|nr:hypothetical protein diail_11020 [Diaporthe ilicicola]